MVPTQAFAGRLQLRRYRIAKGAPCANKPGQPAVIRQHPTLRGRLAGTLLARRVMQRMLRLLLWTVDDEALPWSWRSACLMHTILPLARLSSPSVVHDPVRAATLHACVQVAEERLGVVPPATRSGQFAGSGNFGRPGARSLMMCANSRALQGQRRHRLGRRRKGRCGLSFELLTRH